MKHYFGPDSTENMAYDIAVDNLGNVYVTGSSLSAGMAWVYDHATVKYNSDGSEQWVARYNGPQNLYDGALSLAIDDSENVYVTGFSYIDYYHYVYTTIKYIQSPSVSVKEEKIKTPGGYWLFQNYPNPFNPTTKISYSIPNPDFVTAKIYDMLGREIQTLVNEFQKTGTYSFNFDASKFSSGIYFYKLQVGNYVETKKMLLMR